MRTLNMQFIRYINLFNRISGVRTKHCFKYNSNIIFLVPKNFISKSVGEEGKNIKKLNQILRKKIKIVKLPSGLWDIEEFISAIVYPVQLKKIEVKNNEVVINAGQNKAALIGRQKARLEEMRNIIEQYFGLKNVKIA